jgi:hypothetical protein
VSYDAEIAALEAEWAPDDGFFWHVRDGRLDLVGLERTKAKLARMAFDDASQLPRRLVSLLWYVPLFLEWNRQRHPADHGGVVDDLSKEIERLLGVP